MVRYVSFNRFPSIGFVENFQGFVEFRGFVRSIDKTLTAVFFGFSVSSVSSDDGQSNVEYVGEFLICSFATQEL